MTSDKSTERNRLETYEEHVSVCVAVTEEHTVRQMTVANISISLLLQLSKLPLTHLCIYAFTAIYNAHLLLFCHFILWLLLQSPMACIVVHGTY